MKILRFTAVGLLLLALVAAGPAPSYRVPQAQINAENARWRSYGVKLPPGGIVLQHPYAAPYSDRSFVVPYAWYRDFAAKMRSKGGVAVDAAALRKDLPVLQFLVEKTYAGYGSAKERGWNWQRMFAQWSMQLERDGNRPLTLGQAFAPWGRLQDVQRDNHSGIPGFKGFASGSASAELASKPSAYCSALVFAGGRSVKLDAHDAAQQPHPVQAWSGASLAPAWYLSYPKSMGTAQAVRCGARRIALRTAPQIPAPSQKPLYKMIGNGIAYLRLPSFTEANDNALRAVLSKASDLGKERLIVFDLRGNDGGSAPSEILTNWFAESAVEIAQGISQSSTRSCFATALQFGRQQQFTEGLKTPVSPGLQQVLQELVDTLKGQSTWHCAVRSHDHTSSHSLRDHRFSAHEHEQGQTRVIALVDSGCSGDCEYMTYVLGGLPETVIAGTSTYGGMGFAQPGYFVLPYSHVPFRLALSRTNPYGDGRSVDGYGLDVDVLLPTAQSQSMQSITALAKLLAS